MRCNKFAWFGWWLLSASVCGGTSGKIAMDTAIGMDVAGSDTPLNLDAGIADSKTASFDQIASQPDQGGIRDTSRMPDVSVDRPLIDVPTNTDGGKLDGGVGDAHVFQKLKWTKVGPIFNVRYISGSPSGDMWLADYSNEVLRLRPDGTFQKWELETPLGSGISGIYAAGVEDVYVALDYSNIVFHWDGSEKWKKQFLSTAFGGPVGGSGPTDIYVGQVHSIGDGTWTLPLILNGKPVNDPSKVSSLDTLWANALNDVWAASDNSVFHSIGDQRWNIEDIGTAYAKSIWATTNGEAYVVTDTKVARRGANGKWKVEFTPTLGKDESLFSVWGSGPDDIYVGSFQRMFRSAGDGQWQDEVFPEYIGAMWVIWGRSKTDVYIGTGRGLYHGQP